MDWKSFIVCEQHFDLDEFLSVTTEADAFQIQLSTNESFKEVVRLLIVQHISTDKRVGYIQKKVSELKKLLHYDKRSMEVEVLLVSFSELYTDPNTTKTPMLLDLR